MSRNYDYHYRADGVGIYRHVRHCQHVVGGRMDYLELAKTVGILTGISGGLALLMSIAQNTIGNYGEKEITINGEKKLIMDGGDTLLAGLIDNEVFLPSACGGKGTCGYCKCKVLSGGGQLLATETGLVTAEEAAEGIRLSCQ